MPQEHDLACRIIGRQHALSKWNPARKNKQYANSRLLLIAKVASYISCISDLQISY